MKLNLKALILASGILWALAIFLTGLGNLICAGYGDTFLQVIASVYPGYHATRSLGDVIVGSMYALFDGAVCGLIFGWVYNLFVSKISSA